MRKGETEKQITDTKHIKKKAAKPTVQIGHVAQIKFSGSKIIPSTSYPSIPLLMPSTTMSNEERKHDSIFSFLLQHIML